MSHLPRGKKFVAFWLNGVIFFLFFSKTESVTIKLLVIKIIFCKIFHKNYLIQNCSISHDCKVMSLERFLSSVALYFFYFSQKLEKVTIKLIIMKNILCKICYKNFLIQTCSISHDYEVMSLERLRFSV